MTEVSMNRLNEFTSNVMAVIAEDVFTKKSSSIVQQRLLVEKPNNFTGLSPAGRVLISNTGGNIITSSTTVAEIENLIGVRSDIQGQINDIPASLLASSNAMEQLIHNMEYDVSQTHGVVTSALEEQKAALTIDEIPQGTVNKIIQNGNHIGDLNVNGTLAAANYNFTGTITVSGSVQENFNTETIEIANELNAPALKVVNNISSNILSIKSGTSEAPGSTNRVTVLSNGNMGIGVSNPQEKLDVNGNIRVSGTINGITSTELANFNDVTGNVQEQLDAIGTSISSVPANPADPNQVVTQTLGSEEANVSNYVKQTRNQILDTISEMESNVSNYVDTTYDILMAGKQNKLTFGEGLSYDSVDNSLTVSTVNTLWTENMGAAGTNSINYGNVAVYGDKIEINQKEVLDTLLLGQKQDIFTGAASTIANADLPINKVLVTDASGKIVASSVDAAQLDYIIGVTEPIQPKIDSILADIVATSNEFRELVDSNAENISNYTAILGIELEGRVNNLYDPLTFGSGLVYDEATQTLSTDGTFVYEGTVTISDSVWTSNVEFNYINYEQIKIYEDHVKVNDARIATDLDFAQKQDAINFSTGLSYNGETNTVSLAPGVWEDKGHYVRYKNIRVYNNRMTVGVDDTVDVKKYPPVGLPGITGGEASGVVKTITGQTYGNGNYKIEWSSGTGSTMSSLLFNGNYIDTSGAVSAASTYSVVNDATLGYSLSTSRYIGNDISNYGEWVSIELPDRITLSYVKIYQKSGKELNSPQIYTIYGTNDDITWEKIHTETNASYTSLIHISDYMNPMSSYKKYAILIKKIFGGTTANTYTFNELEFFGVPDETLYLVSEDFATDTTDMLAWYKFDGDFTDSSGNGNDLTNTDCVFDSSSVIANSECVSFTGSSYLSQSNTIYCPQQITISFWGYFTGNGFSQIISTQSGATGWLIQILNNNSLAIFISNNQPQVFTFGASGFPSYNQWFHFVLVLNSVTNIHNAYVNGALIQTYSVTYTPVAQSLSIGTELGTPGYSLKNGEKLDDLRIYNRALTPEEVRVLYRVGKPVLYDFFGDTTDMLAWYKFDGDFTDSSGNGNDLTYDSSAVSLSTDSVSGINSAYLNGSQTNATTLINENIDLTGLNREFSIAYWIKREENNVWYMVSAGTGSSYNNQLYIGYQGVKGSSNDNNLFFGTGDASTSVVTGKTFTEDIGKWEHLVFVRYSDKSVVYKDGNIIETQIGSGLNISGTKFVIGRHYVNTEGLHYGAGNYDDFRIYNRTLTPDEVHTLYAKSSMSSQGQVELHTIKADQIMPSHANDAVNIGNHVQMRTIQETTESLSSRIVNSEVDIIDIRANPYCMRLEKDLWMDGAGIIWTSDQRIKKEITDIDDDIALQKILTIEPKTYKYIDNVGKGDNTVYGFISQQIEEVIPEATKKTPRYIPNVYQYCEYNSSNNTIRLPGDFDISLLNTLIADKFSSNYDDMSSNIVVSNDNHLSTRLKVIDENNQETFLQYSMTSNEDGYELQIHNRDFRGNYSGLSDYDYDYEYSSNIFVYGTEINDLTTLDKSYIYTLNTCATQVLSRKVDSLRLTNETLSQYVEMLEKRISIIRDYVNANSNLV